MRTIVLLGKRLLASSQCWRTNLHAAAPWRRLAMHERSRNGAFCVFTSPLMASSHVRSISASASNSAGRTGGAAGPAASAHRGSPSSRRSNVASSAVEATIDGGGGDELRIDRRPARPRCVGTSSAARCLRGGRRRPGWRGQPVRSPRSLARRSSSPSTGSPSSATTGAEQGPDARLEATAGQSSSSSRPSPRRPITIACHTASSRSPPKPSTKARKSTAGQAPGDDLVPRVVDEVVALEGVERAEHLAGDPARSSRVVADAEEAVAAGVDDHGAGGVGERRCASRRRRAGRSSLVAPLRTCTGTSHVVGVSSASSVARRRRSAAGAAPARRRRARR